MKPRHAPPYWRLYQAYSTINKDSDETAHGTADAGKERDRNERHVAIVALATFRGKQAAYKRAEHCAGPGIRTARDLRRCVADESCAVQARQSR